jgi:protoporphyrinogen oxidase
MVCRGSENGMISILGGGLAGLAVGYYAAKKNLPFRIFEANSKIGGNCITFQHDDFLFDSGAHRIHDKDPEITGEFKNIFGNDLRKIDAPSQIYYKGNFIEFPLSPMNVLKNLGFVNSTRALFELALSRLKKHPPIQSFENFALQTYGYTIAERFLLNYSQKLWGIPCNRLSPHIAGKRLKGLDVKSLVMESIFGRTKNSHHVEGVFYYPKNGIGTIANRLAMCFGSDNISSNSRITHIFHNHSRILGIEINNSDKIPVHDLISTLPLNQFIQMMHPAPPREILELVKGIAFRNLILVAFFIDKKQVTKNASIYFPHRSLFFNRIYEPKNRSREMAPPDKTSLILEIPCNRDDDFWRMEDDLLIPKLRSRLIKIGWIKEPEILGTCVKRLDYAYPVLDIDHINNVEKIRDWLEGFDNLKLSGRNGRFVYAWIHDMMRFGKDIINEYDPIRKDKISKTQDG